MRTSHLGLTFNTVDEILWSSLSKDYYYYYMGNFCNFIALDGVFISHQRSENSLFTAQNSLVNV